MTGMNEVERRSRRRRWVWGMAAVLCALVSSLGCARIPKSVWSGDSKAPDYARRVAAFTSAVKPGQTRAEVVALLQKHGPFALCDVTKGEARYEIHFSAGPGKGCVQVLFDRRGRVRWVLVREHSA